MQQSARFGFQRKTYENDRLRVISGMTTGDILE